MSMAAAIALAAGAVALPLASAGAATDRDPRATLGARIVPTGPAGGFRRLGLAAGEAYVVREERIGTAHAGRSGRRRSLLYLGQLADFQLADEESPARVELIDPIGAPLDAAWRPHEALQAQVDDAAIRQMNVFARAGLVPDGAGRRPRMDFVVNNGDAADNQQRNETEWVVKLLDGGRLDPNSGAADPARWPAECRVAESLGLLDPAEAPRYTGVQDYDDYLEGPAPYFYDPDDPRGKFAAWPKVAGLMDRAQRPFQAAGLDVPSYVVLGNHDGLVQGNAAANAAYEAVATGCVKPLAGIFDFTDLGGALAALTPQNLLALLQTSPGRTVLVPPDAGRQFVNKAQYRALHRTARSPDAHGFGYVDRAELAASRGAASYYSFSPKPGILLIGLDTVSDAGVIGPSADGNVDEPQFRWLERELRGATERDELVFLSSHHAIPSLTAGFADELAPPCTVAHPAFGHDVNPGCDSDPRASQPIRLGADLTRLLHRYPHVVAWVAGHSHVNSVEPYPRPGGGGFWGIRAAAEADWPQQGRLVQVMDNRDGALSIFGTVFDHAGPSAAATGAAGGLDETALAGVARTLAFNDPQTGGNPVNGAVHGEGKPKDRNVELLVNDPRRDPDRYATAGKGRCARATGRIAGVTLGQARLGRTRARTRRAYPASSRSRPRRDVDRFCFVGGRALRVLYVRGRAAALLTNRRLYAVRGIRAGASVRALRRAVRGERRLRAGGRTWWVVRGKKATVVFAVRGRRVTELGLLDRRRSASRARQRRLLRAIG
jgi:metallophosphoesterase (TIGR03767 family)